jgi:hypothetical protein
MGKATILNTGKEMESDGYYEHQTLGSTNRQFVSQMNKHWFLSAVESLQTIRTTPQNR